MLLRLLALFAGGGGGPAPAPDLPPAPGGYLFDDPRAVHEFRIALDDAAVDGLGRGLPDVHAVVEHLGQRHVVGLRLKGSSTYRDLDGKPSFKIDFGEWLPGASLLGTRRLTLNAMVYDASMMRERMAYALYALAGVPAPRHAYARVWVNGDYYGVYSLVETLDEQWLERVHRNDDEGNLYDTTYNQTDLSGLQKGGFVLQEGDPLTAGADIDALIDHLDHSGIDATLTERFDRAEVLTAWAIDLATPNWDGYARNINNYLLYRAAVADRWTFVPWGQDTAFRGDGGVWLGLRGRGVVSCHGDTECRAELSAEILRVLDVWEANDLLGMAEDTWAWLGPLCEADPRRERDCDAEELFDKLRERPNAVRESL
jgi:hypothetical protein